MSDLFSVNDVYLLAVFPAFLALALVVAGLVRLGRTQGPVKAPVAARSAKPAPPGGLVKMA